MGIREEIFKNYSQRNLQDFIEQQTKINGMKWTKTYWNDAEDHPIKKIDELFLAAIPTNNGWWIEKCIVSEDGWLCLATEDEYLTPAGYDLEDVTHWAPITVPYELWELKKK